MLDIIQASDRRMFNGTLCIVNQKPFICHATTTFVSDLDSHTLTIQYVFLLLLIGRDFRKRILQSQR